ncbi:hypothetical protein OE88DRAFT_1733464 [Heliocybe sulcata]|uniref:LysM domain-containing protein n=1 Tax=Heliocybe sulcata TaxID=5364 RepID=A0A5C3N8J6_9AGAM|nr:hypothetical protein OE88DRAFT_1733464 [Heliocybe sulcata]
MLNDTHDNDIITSDPWLETEDIPSSVVGASATISSGLEEHPSSINTPQTISFHVRAHTTDGSVGKGDPLRDSPTTIPNEDGVTRPQLTRMLSDFERKVPARHAEDDQVQPIEQDPFAGLHSPTPTKKVIIHDVKSTDTLQGVALRYGVSMASLRKSNHMWASDSIHLRRQLYIPLEQSSFHKEAETASGAIRRTGQDSTALNLRDVAASELSFFPARNGADTGASPLATDPRRFPQPSGSKFHTIAGSRRARLEEFPVTAGSSVSPDHPVSRLPSQGLSSIFSSTRDTLERFARVSMDSSRTSSDKSNTAAEEHEHEHELDLLNRSEPDVSAWPPEVRASAPGLTSTPLRRASSRGSGRPAAYTPWTGPEAQVNVERRHPVRTAQMEPSPAMQLPVLHSKSHGNSHLHGLDRVPSRGT